MNVTEISAAGAAMLAIGLLAAPVATLNAQVSAPSKADSSFVEEASAGGALEVELGRLAEQKASSPAVKQFGQRMVTDHSKANQELTSAAQASDIVVAPKADSKLQAEKTKLASLSATGFDTTYMKMMVKDHEQDIAEFKKEAKSGKSPAVKQVAAQTLPTLEAHLAEAKQVAKQVGGS